MNGHESRAARDKGGNRRIVSESGDTASEFWRLRVSGTRTRRRDVNGDVFYE